ncbi:MAG: ABC transporter ATP-binding protein [Acidobacteriota bacterium]
MRDFRNLFPFVRPHFFRLALSLLLLVLAGAAEVLTTGLAAPMFDDVLSSAPGPAGAAEKLRFVTDALALIPGGVLTQVAVGLILFTLIKGICIYYSNYGMSLVGQSVVLDLRSLLFEHVLAQSMGFFSSSSTGKLMSRMNSDVEQVQEAVSTLVAELVRESVLLIALIVWVFHIDPALAGLALLITPVALFLTLSMGRRIRRASLWSRENVAALNDMLQQIISGIRVVKAFGMESEEIARYREAGSRLFRANMRAVRILFMNSPVMEILGILCFIPLLYYAHHRIVEGSLTLGLFGTIIFALFRMYDPIRKLSRIHVQFQRALASASRISELLETHHEIQDRPHAVELRGVRQGIEFRGVGFSYGNADGGTPVLQDIQLDVRSRQVIAFVGSSGAGKSTLASLIPRFHDVTAGSILIDGTDLRDYTQASVRRSVAVVTQETFLFNDTVRHNIAYGNLRASQEEIIAAARAAFAHEFIMAFPQKYDTPIGERGQRLSGGERQRIAIARAILKNAPILVLDEATSALDSESEKIVQQALANLMQDRTTFVIAHRLSTIRNADRIVVLERGRIVEMGSHKDLIESDGQYRWFYRLQTEVGSTTFSEKP